MPKDTTCPICNKEKGIAILIPNPDTERGGNVQATPVHADCALSLLKINKDGKIYV